jgi:hypothetical protein
VSSTETRGLVPSSDEFGFFLNYDILSILIFELRRKSNTDKIIKLQYGNWRIFYNKLNSCVINKVLEFC